MKEQPTERGFMSAADTPMTDSWVLVASGLQKSYDAPAGRLEVLKGVDLRVTRGSVVAVLGASGSGKSTLLNILGTLDRPDGGTLAIGGRTIETLRERELAMVRSRHIGFVFQFHHLLPEFTAEENVMMPRLIAGDSHPQARERARRALTSAGLLDRWEHRPSELSGGEAQRVAVARALVSDPELVLADEPSGNLDRRSAESLHEVMSTLAREHHQTFVIVTHNDRLASVADRILVLENGRLVESDER
jgi:lipoprotein-releasing system ATP-binding protein